MTVVAHQLTSEGALYGQAERQCPAKVDLTPEVFAARVAALPKAPEERYLGDFLLALACAAGERDAILVLERLYVAPVAQQMRRFRLTPEETEELLQTLRQRLLVGATPKLATYAGSAPLGAWLHVVAGRIALEMLERRASEMREVAWDVKHLDALGGNLSDATRTLIERHRPAVKECIEAVLATLSPRDRMTLRLHVVDGLGIDGIALVARVHRATVARWLCRIRREVYSDLSKRLGVTFTCSSTEVRSLVAHFQQDLTLSLDRILGDEASDPWIE